jgi:hypothetical protein
MVWPDTKKTLIGTVRKVSGGRWGDFGLQIGEDWYHGPGRAPVGRLESVIVEYREWGRRNELLRIEAPQEDGRIATVWWRGRRLGPDGEEITGRGRGER